ncbi:MAG: hypothetical protein E6600_04620 [Anaerocolumna aminovalerica]|uniref:hypothetical protein n=1 Tax=Anaerocolumna aminovalerica TaxID=1527 RepID=UPI00290C2C53|nr:hypothetical protein [Anaerocolumna aminovalerica]MDU6263766.1 hypothetical protein [Anaerocolumna aminovalerica]
MSWRKWTQEDSDYLSDKWGTVSLKSIAKKLNRTENAILLKVQRLGLGAFLESGEYVTWNQFLYALGIQGGYKYKAISWIKNRGFPIHTKRVHKDSFKVVYIEEFWKWAVKNKDFLDFSKFEENALGKEPEWVKTKRKHDFIKSKSYKTVPWTKTEDLKLKKLLKDYRYTYLELSRILQRTTGAIQRRICELGLKERPLKADNHVKWTDEEFETLYQLIDDGFGYEYMQDIIGKSAKAIRGRVYCFYGTENLDKVRNIRNEQIKVRA